MYYKGQVVTFTTQEDTEIFGVEYRAGEQCSIKLNQDWDPMGPDLGEGGPWGWGGFTSQTLEKSGILLNFLPTGAEKPGE